MHRLGVVSHGVWLIGAIVVTLQAAGDAQENIRYRIETTSDRAALGVRLTESQLGLVEKLNRADVRHLGSLPQVILPVSWTDDELAYSVWPLQYAASQSWPKFLVVYLPGQMFGAYELGTLVRWGPVSSGGRGSPTPAGLFALNWRSTGRASTVDPDWFLPWYFNFGNREGLAFHAYDLPGYPASHGCIRLLERDAEWLFAWGEAWTLDASETRILQSGTPVLIVGTFDFDAAPPWRSLSWLSRQIDLPAQLFIDGSPLLPMP